MASRTNNPEYESWETPSTGTYSLNSQPSVPYEEYWQLVENVNSSGRDAYLKLIRNYLGENPYTKSVIVGRPSYEGVWTYDRTTDATGDTYKSVSNRFKNKRDYSKVEVSVNPADYDDSETMRLANLNYGDQFRNLTDKKFKSINKAIRYAKFRRKDLRSPTEYLDSNYLMSFQKGNKFPHDRDIATSNPFQKTLSVSPLNELEYHQLLDRDHIKSTLHRRNENGQIDVYNRILDTSGRGFDQTLWEINKDGKQKYYTGHNHGYVDWREGVHYGTPSAPTREEFSQKTITSLPFVSQEEARLYGEKHKPVQTYEGIVLSNNINRGINFREELQGLENEFQL